jgi:DNA polymerase-3 subunit beta
MKFTVSRSALLSLLATTGKVINSKNTLPILDYFLMELKGGELKVTTSDLETTIVGVIKVDNVEKEGMVAAPSKLMLDVLKECSEMPLCLEVNPDNWEIQISWRSGKSVVPGANPVSYPQTHELSENKTELSLDVDILVNGINKTIFATADDELRPVMNGVYFNFDDSAITCVATAAHKLVKHTVEAASGVKSAFILPKKPANLLKNLLLKEEGEVKMTFDEKNVVFSLSSSTLVCRLIEGTYPNYTVVIPQANPNKMLVDRIELLNAIKRVAVCSNSTTNLIRLDISNNKAILAAHDVNFSISADESLSCSYEGVPITIGFKSTFLVEILSNIETPTVLIELADGSRAGVFKPVYDDVQKSETLMLLMPMMINA